MAGAYRAKDAKKYTGWFYNEHGRRQKFQGGTDKTSTLAEAEALEKTARLTRAGVISAVEESVKAAKTLPLSSHIDEYRDSLLAKGATVKHARSTASVLVRFCAAAKIKTLSGITAEAIERGLLAVEREGRSARTYNKTRGAVKAFSVWCWERSKISEPIRGLKAIGQRNEAADRRRVRRALTSAELSRLIAAAHDGGPVDLSRRGYQYEHREITGPDRAILYRLAAGTGFRANELRSLTPESFDLGDKPTVTVTAGYSKNGRLAVQPITQELAAILRPWLATRTPGRPVLEVPEKTAQLLRVDLKAAGIPEVDAAGSILDFHAIRATYITELVRNGVHLAIAQRLARHSDPKTTMAYTKLGDELRDAIERKRDQ